ncbi:MAG: acyltransferase family protein [Acidimicrobiia bacterium]
MHGGSPAAGPWPAPVVTTALGHRRSLDGLRALAVVAVVAFHSGLARGGFLGVSTFFTLSGFLITYLLIDERRRDGRIALGRFYARRVARLVPAALVAMATIAVLVLTVGTASQRARLGSDLVAALTYGANWHFVAAGDRYGALFSGSSPLLHFWSLAVEEQMYLVVPLLLVLAGAGARRRSTAGAAIALVLPASTGLGVALSLRGSSLDRLYFGTDTRATEVLIGVLLAVVVHGRMGAGFAGVRRHVVQGAGMLALSGQIVCWFLAPEAWMGWYRGGLVAYALAGAVVIVAALQPVGILPRLLSYRPLVGLGAVSYGVYLFHVPVFEFLGAADAHSRAWFVPRAVATLVAAWVSFRLVERPIRAWSSRSARAGSGRHRGVFAFAVPAACLLLIAGVLVSGPDRDAGVPDFEQALRAFNVGDVPAVPSVGEAPVAVAAASAPYVAPTSVAPTTTVAPDPPVSIAFYGDSTALMTGLGFSAWATAHADLVEARRGWVGIGCGTLVGVSRRIDGKVQSVPPDCAGWQDKWEASQLASGAEVAVVQFGPWEMVDQRLPGGSAFLAPDDPELDALALAALSSGVDRLLQSASAVVLLTAPLPDSATFTRGDPSRLEPFNRIQEQIAAAHPSNVTLVDLAGFVEQHPDIAVRPDGVHFTNESAAVVAAWLGPAIVDAYRSVRR